MNGLPKVLAQREPDGRIELHIEVPADNRWFEGHFPEFAILPGVVQIGWAAHFGHSLLKLGPDVMGMEHIKFKRPILPGAQLILSLKLDAAAGKLRYEYLDGEQSCSSGVLLFGASA
jgi:3-hydroxymyristoyl/3-hydroxydecanoyl-(acyl carrier protein) dehydratase